jgi:hypothetical protein
MHYTRPPAESICAECLITNEKWRDVLVQVAAAICIHAEESYWGLWCIARASNPPNSPGLGFPLCAPYASGQPSESCSQIDTTVVFSHPPSLPQFSKVSLCRVVTHQRFSGCKVRATFACTNYSPIAPAQSFSHTTEEEHSALPRLNKKGATRWGKVQTARTRAKWGIQSALADSAKNRRFRFQPPGLPLINIVRLAI